MFPKQNLSVWLCGLEINGQCCLAQSFPTSLALRGRGDGSAKVAGKYVCRTRNSICTSGGHLHLPLEQTELAWVRPLLVQALTYMSAARFWKVQDPVVGHGPWVGDLWSSILRRYLFKEGWCSGTWVTHLMLREGFPFRWQTIPELLGLSCISVLF